MRVSMNNIRGIVRPAATAAFGLAFLAYAHYDPEAFERIKETAIAVVLFWFGSRESSK